jgi:hypothetical protein
MFEGINEPKVQSSMFNVQCYPNPATNYITISQRNAKSEKPNKYVLTLRNIEGQKLLSENVEFTSTYKLDISSLTNGVYFLTMQNNQKNYVSKVVIQK